MEGKPKAALSQISFRESKRSMSTTRYATVRGGGRALAGLAPVARYGIAALGLVYFLEQAQGLMSDAQFTWAERRIMGLMAVATVIGFGLAGWVVGRLLQVVAGLMDVLADGAEASWRTVDLMELHVIPTLGRIAAALESAEGAGAPASPSPRAVAPSVSSGGRRSRVDELTTELKTARADEDVDRALDLRDALTEHLRGESLHALDRELAGWVKSLAENRARSNSVDWRVAGWVARTLDSLGETPETEPLRAGLPNIRQRAGLCRACGRAVAGGRAFCGRCRPDDEPTTRGNRRNRSESTSGDQP